MTYREITVNVDNLPISVKWSNFNENVSTLMRTQKQLKNKTEIVNAYNYFFKLFSEFGLYKNLPRGATILDIGSGISIIDLIAHQTIPDSVFYLLDKDVIEVTPSTTSSLPFFTNNYKFYNSWQPVIDAIETTGLNKNNFKFLSTNDQWPVMFDVITSFSSWCWHYPFSTYWDNVKSSIKKQGRFFIQVSNWAISEEPNLINTISEFFNSRPIIKPITKNMIRNNPKLLFKDDCYGYYCMWVNNKE